MVIKSIKALKDERITNLEIKKSADELNIETAIKKLKELILKKY